MRIEKWLFENQLTRTRMAKDLGITRCHFHHIISGKASPSRNLARKIYRLTGGKVKVKTKKKMDDWEE